MEQISKVSLDVYKLRIAEVIRNGDEKVKSLDLAKKFSDNMDTSSSSSYWKFKDSKTAKDTFKLAAGIFESNLSELNTITPPVGLEKDHEQIKKFLNNSKDLANEVLSFSDDQTEFGKKTDINLVKWRQLAEDTQKIFDKLSISSGNLSSYISVTRR